MRIKKILIVCFTLFFSSFGLAEEEAKLTNIAVMSKGQITLSLDQPVAYKTFTLDNPARLVIDLQKTLYDFSGGKSVDFSQSDVTDFRHGIQNGYNLRIVFDLKKPTNFNIETNHEKGFQINLILSSPAVTSSSPSSTQPLDILPPFSDDDVMKTQDTITLKKITATLSPSSSSQQKRQIPQIIPHKKSKFIVVIDPGHGGKDPGAKGPRGAEEKKVTLAIAKDLQELINEQRGMKAVLTRSGDYYVGLRKRLLITRKAKGDVFVAIHADAFNQPDAEGASVFALSLHGASSEAALWLAQKENYSELSGINLNGIQDHDAQVRSVLIDLSQTAAINASLKLGQNEISQLGRITDLHHGIVEQAPFMVLKSPDVPSILVETGFITNPKEEARLKTEAYQEKIARALMAGINNYYRQDTVRNLPIATSVN